jgi:LytS/YehU family sensor histidine kinase
LRESKTLDIHATTALVPANAPITSPTILPSNGGGIGLTNLRARLETLYGASQKLELHSRSGGGVTVRVEIPWRPAGSVETPAAATNS